MHMYVAENIGELLYHVICPLSQMCCQTSVKAGVCVVELCTRSGSSEVSWHCRIGLCELNLAIS